MRTGPGRGQRGSLGCPGLASLTTDVITRGEAERFRGPEWSRSCAEEVPVSLTALLG